MEEKKIYDIITGVDDDLIDRSLKNNTRSAKAKKARLRFVMIAACVALLIVGAVIIIPGLLPGSDRVINPPDGSVPSIPLIKSSSRITGKQELTYGNPVSAEGNADIASPGFYIRTVIEAEVIEVLPDDYFYIASGNRSFHVAKLRVIDQIRGNGFPNEIYLSFFYKDTTVFDGYERFIMSLDQIGIENYALINRTQSRVDYFPNMFTVTMGDLEHGSVIAFNNGRVDDGFLNTSQHEKYCSAYPASGNDAIGKVKTRILELAKDVNNLWVYRGSDYVTADDVFISPEAKEIRAYLEPDENNVFIHNISFSYDFSNDEDRVIASYTRIINGFRTDEKIGINGYTGEVGNVSRSEAVYSEENLLKIPDIGEAIANIDLTDLKPPHIEVTVKMKLVYSNAMGIYRNIGGKVYGVIRVMWYYSSSEYYGGFMPDDMYILYGEDGSGSILERDELREIIGDDAFIERFPYGGMMFVFF